LGGLLAARVLSDYFDEVMILDGDELPGDAIRRSGFMEHGFAKLAAAVALATLAVPNLTFAQHYTQTNLISDLPGMAAQTDPNLKNSWGLTRSPTVQPSGAVGSPWWIANNNSGTSTLDNGNGNPQNIFAEANGSISNFVVVPPPGFAAAGTRSTPTDIVYNGSPTDFLLNQGKPAVFIFCHRIWHPLRLESRRKPSPRWQAAFAKRCSGSRQL
jgi:hypothetical protein